MHSPTSTSRGSKCCVRDPGKLQEACQGVLLGWVEWGDLEQSWRC